ncbi:MAG: hypothetical protein RR310_07250 [Eubacterium sp.]
MAQIVAKGKVRNKNMIVICEDMKFTFDGKENRALEQLILDESESVPPIGGTFYPEKNTMLAVKSVLENIFFDELLDVDVTGDIGTIPYEENIIY